MDSDKNNAQAVGHIPSGLFIICGEKKGEAIDGFLASWVQQVSFQPLIVSFAIKPGRPAYDAISSGETFTINIVGEHDKSYLRHFWKGYNPQENPFVDLIPFQRGKNNGIIINAAKSTLECKIKEKIKPGDHEIIIAEVLSSYTLNDLAKPTVHIRKTGLDY